MLRLSEQAARQMGYARNQKEAEEARKLKREQQRAAKEAARQERANEREAARADQQAYRERVKQHKQTALDSDAKLTESVAEFKRIEDSQSVRAKARAEEQREEAVQAHEQAKAKIRDLEKRLAQAHNECAVAAKRAGEMHERYQAVVVDAAKSLDEARAAMQAAWSANEDAWSQMYRGFVKEKRNRAVRREAKSLLS